MMWKMIATGVHDLPSPLEFGYEMRDNNLYQKLMDQSPAPPELINDRVCSCSGTCHFGCPCFENEQPCTAACIYVKEILVAFQMTALNALTVLLF